MLFFIPILFLFLAGVEAVSVRSLLNKLSQVDENIDMFSQPILDLKSLFSIKVNDFLPLQPGGRIKLPSEPSLYQVASLLEVIKRNSQNINYAAYSLNMTSNPTSLVSLLVCVSLLYKA